MVAVNSLGKIYDIIKKPLNTEKTNRDLEVGKYYFSVDTNSTKKDVKNAIEKIFGVLVEAVNIINLQGKKKRFKGSAGKRNDVKKAIVTLQKGQNINFNKIDDK